MATDISRLLTLLSDYHEALTVQHRQLTQAHTELAGRYRALGAVYEGRGAEEFKGGWARVEAAFTAYDDGIPQVLTLLADKIEQLRALDQGL